MEQLKYKNLADFLRKNIADEIYEEGMKLPSENQLSKQFGISRQTVRQAMSLLEAEGLTSCQRGSGTYVKVHIQNKQHTNNVAVITTYISEYIFPAILQGIEGVLSANNYTSMISATKNRIYNERNILNGLKSKPIDGIIVEGTKTALPNPNVELYHDFINMGIPVVFINGFYPELKNPVYVVTDDRKGGYIACQTLLKQNCSKISGFFKSDDIQGHRRYAGFSKALIENNLDLSDDRVIWYTTETRDSILEANVISIAEKSDGIVCYNDEIAMQVISILHKNAPEYMEKISFASFDNSLYANMSAVKITSLCSPKFEIGKIAAEKLLNIINGNKESSQVLSWSLED